MAFTCVHIGASWASHLGYRFRANNETKKAFIVFVFWKVVKSCTAESCIMMQTRAVLRLVWPSILLLFIERWRHLADSNEPNLIKKNVFYIY